MEVIVKINNDFASKVRVYGARPLKIDHTLTHEGQAADAHAVGAAIESAAGRLTHVYTDIGNGNIVITVGAEQ